MRRDWREIPRERGDGPRDTSIHTLRDTVSIEATARNMWGDRTEQRMHMRLAPENVRLLARTLAARFAIDGFPDLAFANAGDQLRVEATSIDMTRDFTVTNRRDGQTYELVMYEALTEDVMQKLFDTAWKDEHQQNIKHAGYPVSFPEAIEESYSVDSSEADVLYVRHLRRNGGGEAWEGRLVVNRKNLPWITGSLLTASLASAPLARGARRIAVVTCS
jgi:hypothetical protein